MSLIESDDTILIINDIMILVPVAIAQFIHITHIIYILQHGISDRIRRERVITKEGIKIIDRIIIEMRFRVAVEYHLCRNGSDEPRHLFHVFHLMRFVQYHIIIDLIDIPSGP